MEEGIFRVSEAPATPAHARSRPGSGKEARSPTAQNGVGGLRIPAAHTSQDSEPTTHLPEVSRPSHLPLPSLPGLPSPQA